MSKAQTQTSNPTNSVSILGSSNTTFVASKKKGPNDLWGPHSILGIFHASHLYVQSGVRMLQPIFYSSVCFNYAV